jgi:Flp pilus assembly pilin Flp
MRIAMHHARIFYRTDCGATAIEYGLIAGLIFCVIVGGVGALGQGVMNVLYNKIETLF